MSDITVQELKQKIDAGDAPIMIDVREPREWAMQHLDEVRKVSLSTLPTVIADLTQEKDKEIVLICRSGGRSGSATNFLKKQGFTNARNLAGGMLAWKKYIDTSFNVS